MITRKAIIIGNNTGYQASKHLGGVDHDIKNYTNYLLSEIGGSWLQSEILILHNKTKTEIITAISLIRADYSFIIYTGHGFTDKTSGTTYMCVKDDFLSEHSLKTTSTRQSTIFDCCRSLESLNESVSGFSGTLQNLSKGGEVRTLQRKIINSRNIFDQALSQSSLGSFKAYSCLVGQTSGDNPNSGGVFLTQLLKVGYEFGNKDNPKTNWLDMENAVKHTIIRIKANPFTTQIPTYNKNPANINPTAPFALTNYINSLL